MNLPQVNEVKTADEAEQLAIDWQHWQAEQPMSYAQLALCQDYFGALGLKFNLIKEFEENGIL